MNDLKKRVLTVIVASCGLLLLAGANAWAVTTVFTDEGPRYWEVVERAEEIFGWGIVGVDDDGALIVGETHYGWKITYDIFNNSTYTINGFMVGVSDELGSGRTGDDSSPAGWSGYVTNRWNYPNNGNYWNSELGLTDYNYAYKAEVLMGCIDCGNDSFPPGEPLQPFQRITGEFSFESDSDELSSPVILFATDTMGQDIVLFGESSYVQGTGQNYVSSVPIPGTVLLLASGLLGFAGFRRKID